MQLHLSEDGTHFGLRTIVLSNGQLRVRILPQAGGKIWQITHIPTRTDLLWNNPHIPPAVNAIHAPYDDVWSGGWDDLFPVDEQATILGERYPDHGELWTAAWKAETWSTLDEVGVVLRLKTPISYVTWEKKISLRRESSCLSVSYKLTNHGDEDFPFLWKLHPAFAVTEQHRIDFPAMRVVREPDFPGTLEQAPLSFDWPLVKTPAGEIDLRLVPPSALKQLYFFYGTAMQAGWCALTNTATKLSCGLVFDPAVFPYCWLFADYGGWLNHQVAVLEPCTGFPLNFDTVVKEGRQRILRNGETFATDVLFTVEEGHSSIAGIQPNGTMTEGPIKST